MVWLDSDIFLLPAYKPRTGRAGLVISLMVEAYHGSSGLVLVSLHILWFFLVHYWASLFAVCARRI